MQQQHKNTNMQAGFHIQPNVTHVLQTTTYALGKVEGKHVVFVKIQHMP